MAPITPSEPPQRSVIARAASGAGWVIGWRFATRFIGFGSTLVLVRLLTPDDFGLVSLAIGLIQSLDTVAGFGVEGAIIRIPNPGRDVYDAGFTITVIRGLTTSILLSAAAIPLAQFFKNPDLANVIWVFAAAWAINAFTNIGMVEYRRTMAFDMEFKIKIIPRILALLITLPSALIWHSYWALVAGIVATQLMTVILSYALHPYRPRFGTAGMPQIFGFSLWEWIISMVNLVGGRADTMIIGRILGTASVGIYGVGLEIATLPNGEIVAPLCRVLFSGFVEEKREGRDGRPTLLRVLALLTTVTLPLNIGLSLVAYPIIRLCFGTEWLGAVPLLELLGVAGSLSLFNAIGESLFSAYAWLRTIFWMSVVTTVLRIAMLLVMIPAAGLLGGAIAAAIVGIVQEAIYIYSGLRRLKLQPLSLLACVARPAIAGTAMAAILALSGLGWTHQDQGTGPAAWANLIAASSLGAIVYITVLLATWLAAGRPPGPETDALALAARLLRRIRPAPTPAPPAL